MGKRAAVGLIRSIAMPGSAVAACILIMSGLPSANAADHATGSEKIVKETKEAVEATQQYTIEKEAFERAVQAELRDIQAKIALLQDQNHHGVRRGKDRTAEGDQGS